MKKTLIATLFVILIPFLSIALAEENDREEKKYYEVQQRENASKAIQLSLTPNIARHDRSETIEGLSLNIWGENPQSALSLGFVNGSTGQSVGLSLGLILNYADRYKGIHLAPVNYASRNFFGVQLGCVNYALLIKGFQLGFVNCAESTQNFGLQLGYVNYSGRMKGLQIGLINYAETAQTGVQIGLVNIIAQNEKWFGNFPDDVAPGMLIVNWRF